MLPQTPWHGASGAVGGPDVTKKARLTGLRKTGELRSVSVNGARRAARALQGDDAMTSTRRWTRTLSGWLVAMGLAGQIGCLGFLHPVTPLPQSVSEPCQIICQPQRKHVYIFFVNGLDPVNYGNVCGVRDYVQSLGYNKTYYGQIYHLWYFSSEIRRIHKEDPDARFVLVGFSLGVNVIDAVSHAVKGDGVSIDMMIFLSGNHPVMRMPHEKPENVERVVNILASGIMQTRGDRDYAENVRLADARHFDSPTHRETLEALARELASVAASVPMPQKPADKMPPALEETPTPRPVMPRSAARRDDWDFLKPVSRMRLPPATEEPTAPPTDADGVPKPRPVVPPRERIALQ
jgi:hypothetical protein